MDRSIITKSAAETKKIASNFVHQISATPRVAGAVIIGLIGELGSGKTTFTQGFAKGLGIKGNITSPTFVLEKIYEIISKQHRHFIHIDAYRIDNPKELLDLGFNDLIKNNKNIILIEWADKIKNILPKGYIRIEFFHKKEKIRKIIIN